MAQTTTEAIVTSELRGAVKWVRFNRPEVKNAIAPESADLMRVEVEAAPGEGARVIVITGNGGSFCAGADLKALAPRLGGEMRGVRQALVEHYHTLVLAMTRSTLPVIAAVDGAAAGIGSDIALAADIRLATPRAFFAEIFVNIALIPDGGGSFTLPRLIGSGRALEMAFTGQRVAAEQAHAWGMVNHVYAAEGFEDQVQEFAEQIAAKAPLSLAHSKLAIRSAMNAGTLEQALLWEATLQEELIGTHDFKEGVMAFLEKRPPQFQGK
ncbi:MAG: enoyl-CoA hydratase/isomerase family protein [Planctomycetaceae bacterium]|nr:enoyl-CoA hydratase/isomerase family protein [Planctomycetaceae bacterium]